MSREYRPARWTTWSRPWASTASLAARSAASARPWMARLPPSAPVPSKEECPYVILDATFHKVRELDRVVSVACVVAGGRAATGERGGGVGCCGGRLRG